MQRPAGAHRYWRLVCAENKGSNWYEKFEWYSVPNDVMADMKRLMEAVQAVGGIATPAAAVKSAVPQTPPRPQSAQAKAASPGASTPAKPAAKSPAK